MMRMAITITTFTVVQMIPTKKLQACTIVTVLTTAIMIAMTKKILRTMIQIYIYSYNYIHISKIVTMTMITRAKTKMRLTTYGHDKRKNHNDIYHNLLCNYQQSARRIVEK